MSNLSHLPDAELAVMQALWALGRYLAHTEDAQGRDVTIRDSDYLRSVTVDGTTTYTVHWTGVAFLVYAIAASLLRAIHWLNPMVWLRVGRLRRKIELCCDYALLKRRGRMAMAAALLVVVLAGSLVGCRTGASTPAGDGAWIAGIDLDAGTITYYPLSQGLIADEAALEDWIWGEEGMRSEEPRTVPLSEDSQFLHTYEGEIYPIPPATLQFSISMSQTGALGEVEVEGDEAVRVQLASTAQLDLSAPALDFTG